MKLMRATFAVLLGAAAVAAVQQAPTKRSSEAEKDYNRKWLQDVSYIITDEERAIFENLQTPEEIESFIEQFWRRRDPKGTGQEVREEHYRRVAYANENFASGVPGWKTDRGRVYIINGKPDSIEEHGQGEQHYRRAAEGGGTTATYAYQVWYYRNIPGMGEVEIEFVDKRMNGNYTIARDEMEKDAFLFVPGMGLTDSEKFGPGWLRAERIGTRSMASDNERRRANPLKIWTRKDDLFDRLSRIEKLMAPQEIKFKDLQAVVETNITYNEVPFSVRTDLIRITSTEYMVPITLYFNRDSLTFKSLGPAREAELNVYGHIENLARQRVWSFDDVVKVRETEAVGPAKRSLYQRNVPMRPGRYKLVAVIKDANSKRVGIHEKLVVVPSPKENPALELSPIILADLVQPAKTGEFINDAFVLGAVRVYPSPVNTFVRGVPLGFYVEIYNMLADSQTLDPVLGLELELQKDGKPIQLPFSDLERLLHAFGDRYYAGAMLSTQPLEPGRYQLTLKVTDKIAQKTATQTAQFTLEDGGTVN
jgi:GWxTD domain-containing protein